VPSSLFVNEISQSIFSKLHRDLPFFVSEVDVTTCLGYREISLPQMDPINLPQSQSLGASRRALQR
jgi:hypothetical protein